MQADSIIFYRTFYEALKDDISDADFLPPGEPSEGQRIEAQQAADAAKWRALEALFQYSFEDADPDELLGALDGVARTVFRIARPLIDANHARREGGKKGGRPRKHVSEALGRSPSGGGYIDADGKFHK